MTPQILHQLPVICRSSLANRSVKEARSMIVYISWQQPCFTSQGAYRMPLMPPSFQGLRHRPVYPLMHLIMALTRPCSIFRLVNSIWRQQNPSSRSRVLGFLSYQLANSTSKILITFTLTADYAAPYWTTLHPNSEAFKPFHSALPGFALRRAFVIRSLTLCHSAIMPVSSR